MIKLDDLYAFVESNFDFLFVVDKDERVQHMSRLLCRAVGVDEIAPGEQVLDRFLAGDSLKTFRAAMTKAEHGSGGIAVFTPRDGHGSSIPLKIKKFDADQGTVFVFFGARVDTVGQTAEGEKDERIKELFCLYSVAEWIEASRSIEEFFNRLPSFLSRGMQHPDQTVVYAPFEGQAYGQPIPSDQFLRAELLVRGEKSGEIRVGYIDPELALLPDEQRMLDEIIHMLNLAIERKQLAESLDHKSEEEEESRKQMADLKSEIDARTRDLEEQRNKLSTIDTYMERVNRNWEESKARLETMFDMIPGDVALIDRNRNVVMSNQAEVEPGDKCHQALFGRDRPCEDCRLAKILRDKAPITHLVMHEDRHLEVHAMPVFTKDHEVEGIMEFYRDVTLEKTYQEQLQRADQMASLGQLVSGIGHEINNPNQFIRGNIKILKQALEDILPIVDDYQKDHPDFKVARLPYAFFREHIMVLVNDMAHGSERIKGIVEGLRRFVRRDEGQQVDKVDVNTLIEACSRLVHNEVSKRAELELALEPDLPSFTGNSQKIEQVLVNLIVNAAQAMPDDDKGHITVRSRLEDGHVVFEIEDNGKGMNEKTQKQIFDPFFTTKRARGGTGLGLAIAYRIIEEHGGTISVSSEVGKGTKFVICIPAGGQEAQSAPDEQTEAEADTAAQQVETDGGQA